MVHRYAFGYSVDNVPYLGDTYPNNHPKKGHEVAFSQQTSKILQLAYYQNHFIDFNQIWHDSRDHHQTLVQPQCLSAEGDIDIAVVP